MSNRTLDKWRDQVLDFWFGPPPVENRAAWFTKDDGFDADIRARFSGLHAAAANGELDGMACETRGCLALIIILDQFSRNLFRDDPRAWAYDPKALFLARQAIKQGFDRACTDIERTFIYLPFEHSEDLQVQVESVALFDTIDNELNQQFARRHLEIIERFGRFPHRNDVLGRVTTAAEREVLKESDSAF